MSGSDAIVDSLVKQLHLDGKLRVWSIIVTVFGDAIVPRGGVISLSSLQDILSRLDIEPNAVRTAMSRLARDGWVKRRKVGRQSFYDLAESGMALFESATARIYAMKSPDWDGRFELVLRTEDDQKSRISVQRRMRQKGYGSPVNGLYIRPLAKNESVEHTEDALAVMEAGNLVTGSLSDFIERSWRISDLNSRYENLIDKYSRVLALVQQHGLREPLDCMAVRVLLIHDWRRLVLQDVDLPGELKPQDWVGEDARALVSEIYHLILPGSECFLDGCFATPEQKMQPAVKELHTRFR
ncbi:MAG: PaaX family transcriptional regulator C-terminal domain-containing protein [Pseudomonadota bacterium]